RERNRDDGVSEEALQTLREDHRAAERAVREYEKRNEEIKDELADLMREAAVQRGRLGDLAGERAELEERMQSLAGTAPKLAESVSAGRAGLASAEAALAAAREQVARREAIQRDTAEREIDLRTIVANHAARVAALREELRKVRDRAHRIMPNGAGEKLRSVLESLNGDRPRSDPTMLLDVIKAPPAMEPVLRALLGEQLDAVIVDSPNFALRAIEILKRKEGGRLSFIPESIAASAVQHQIDAPGIAGRLLDMVDVEPRFARVAEALMGHVIVAEDLGSAMMAANLNGTGAVFVTRDGDLLAPGRVISGGSGGHVESDAEIDMRKRKAALDEAVRSAAEAEADHEELIRRYEWARLAYRDDTDALKAARAAVTQAERSANDLRAGLARAEQQLALAEANRAGAQRRIADVANLAVAANARLEELAGLEQGSRERLNAEASALAQRRAQARRLGDLMLDAGAKVEARKAALNALEQELRHQRRIADDLDAQIERHRGEIVRARAERAEFERELEALAAQDVSATERRRDLEARIEDLTARGVERESALEAARAALKAARQTADSLEAEATQCGLRRERANTLIEELERSFAEKFQAPFAEFSRDLEAALTGRDAARDNERLNELRARAEKIGEVNLAAESEVKELEERAGTLRAERADLLAAVNDLSHTIQKLNREARRRFAETFEGAAKNFAELFPKLMRGGKGRLELTAADDVLEAGVNVLVQPPGKKVKEIGLLSGGEKALSAMALIFSLFLLNPSPFCLMDEVDAPLDEFSLAAFTGLVQELKARSQFIIITHNQRTMQAADHIHGVTMDRPGISKIISLKIPDAA
ncbi:MAG TPA: hypothetical protein VJ718_03280, partial [Candidatus Binataceae bacterium]|nr:hypothetical protein [Candidatus Binataceae bacterium]